MSHACEDASDCTELPEDTACGFRQCNEGVCEWLTMPEGQPLQSQEAGDCVELKCDGEGGIVQAFDELDVLDDGNQCTIDLCDPGPVSIPEMVDTVCQAGACDGSGNCVGCQEASDCGVTEDCTVYACNQGVCEVSYLPEDTVLPTESQVEGDCIDRVCGALGTVVEVANEDDPFDDGKECTTDSCNGTTPGHQPLPTSTLCSEGYCVPGGECAACYSAAQCNGDDVCHSVSHTCVECQSDGDCDRNFSSGSCDNAQCSLASCSSSRFDVDGDWGSGCEVDRPSSATAAARALDLGSRHCTNSETFSSGSPRAIYADGASHPSIPEAELSEGASKLYFKIQGTGNDGLNFCTKDYEISATQSGGTPNCYRMYVTADLSRSCTIGATGCTVSAGGGAYDTDDVLEIRIEKVCPTTLHESPTFVVSGHL